MFSQLVSSKILVISQVIVFTSLCNTYYTIVITSNLFTHPLLSPPLLSFLPLSFLLPSFFLLSSLLSFTSYPPTFPTPYLVFLLSSSYFPSQPHSSAPYLFLTRFFTSSLCLLSFSSILLFLLFPTTILSPHSTPESLEIFLTMSTY